MSLFGSRKIICPFCLCEIKGGKTIERCPSCKAELPVQYVHDYDSNLPFFVQIFGWSQHGKTVFLSALTLMLVQMGNVWPRYAPSAANDTSQRKVREIRQYLANGTMPRPTDMGSQEIYVMILRNMERWGGRTLVTRDCPGEIFDRMKVPVEQAPFLLNAPTTFMLVSLPDLTGSDGKSIDQLMNNYVNTLMANGVKFEKQRRKLVVVFTKADLIPGLPPNLRNYLINDPLWAAVNSPNPVQLDSQGMAEYLEVMQRVSNSVRDWIAQDAAGKSFTRLAELRNIEVRYSLVSSTGYNPQGAAMAITPRRVLDPYFWALELQSRT